MKTLIFGAALIVSFRSGCAPPIFQRVAGAESTANL